MVLQVVVVASLALQQALPLEVEMTVPAVVAELIEQQSCLLLVEELEAAGLAGLQLSHLE